MAMGPEFAPNLTSARGQTARRTGWSIVGWLIGPMKTHSQARPNSGINLLCSSTAPRRPNRPRRIPSPTIVSTSLLVTAPNPLSCQATTQQMAMRRTPPRAVATNGGRISLQTPSAPGSGRRPFAKVRVWQRRNLPMQARVQASLMVILAVSP